MLEQYSPGKTLFDNVNEFLTEQVLILREGIIIDAGIISEAKPIKNKDNRRDSEMHQTKKGNEWYFDIMLHIEVDDMFDLVHSFSIISAYVHDITETGKLLHSEKIGVWSVVGYVGFDNCDV